MSEKRKRQEKKKQEKQSKKQRQPRTQTTEIKPKWFPIRVGDRYWITSTHAIPGHRALGVPPKQMPNWSALCTDVLTIIFSYLSNKQQYKGVLFANKLFYEIVINHCQRPDLSDFHLWPLSPVLTAIYNQDYECFLRYKSKGCNIAETGYIRCYSTEADPRFMVDIYEEFKKKEKVDELWSDCVIRKLLKFLCCARRPDLVKDILQDKSPYTSGYFGCGENVLKRGFKLALERGDIDTVMVIMDSENYVPPKFSFYISPTLIESCKNGLNTEMLRKFFSHPKIANGNLGRDIAWDMLKFALREHRGDIIFEMMNRDLKGSDNTPIYAYLILRAYLKDSNPERPYYNFLMEWIKQMVLSGELRIPSKFISELANSGREDLAISLMVSMIIARQDRKRDDPLDVRDPAARKRLLPIFSLCYIW